MSKPLFASLRLLDSQYSCHKVIASFFGLGCFLLRSLQLHKNLLKQQIRIFLHPQPPSLLIFFCSLPNAVKLGVGMAVLNLWQHHHSKFENQSTPESWKKRVSGLVRVWQILMFQTSSNIFSDANWFREKRSDKLLENDEAHYKMGLSPVSDSSDRRQTSTLKDAQGRKCAQGIETFLTRRAARDSTMCDPQCTQVCHHRYLSFCGLLRRTTCSVTAANSRTALVPSPPDSGGILAPKLISGNQNYNKYCYSYTYTLFFEMLFKRMRISTKRICPSSFWGLNDNKYTCTGT